MIRCPYCSRENIAAANNCSNCGIALTADAVSRGPLSNVPPFTNSGSNASPPQARQTFGPPPAPTFQPPSSQTGQTFGPPPELTFHSPGSQAMQAPAPQTMQPPIRKMGEVPTEKRVSLRRAFAGYGIPLNHHSFLLPRKEVEASNVLLKITEILRKRNPSFQLRGETLREL